MRPDTKQRSASTGGGAGTCAQSRALRKSLPSNTKEDGGRGMECYKGGKSGTLRKLHFQNSDEQVLLTLPTFTRSLHQIISNCNLLLGEEANHSRCRHASRQGLLIAESRMGKLGKQKLKPLRQSRLHSKHKVGAAYHWPI